MLRELSTYATKKRLDPDLQRLLQPALQNPSSPTITKRDFPKHLHDLITLQSRIGWLQLYLGRFTIEWLNQQEAYSASQGQNDNSKQIITGIIIIIFRHLHQRWVLCCSIAHTPTDSPTPRETQLRNEATSLYECQPHMPPTTHHIFSTPLQTLLQKPINSIKLWIDCNQKFIRNILIQTRLSLSQRSQQSQSYDQPSNHST